MTAHGETPAAPAGALVEFADVQRVLSLFADGIAGVAMQLEVVGERYGGWPWTVSLPAGGAQSPPIVRLPASMDDFASARENSGAYRAAVLHQVGYAEFGALEFSTDELDGDTATAAPSPPPPPPAVTETPARSGLQEFFDRADRPEQLRDVFTLLEDLRIDAATRRRYPGARADLDRVLALARERRPEPAAHSGEPDAEASSVVLELLRLRSRGASAAALAGRVAADHSGVAAGVLARADLLESPAATVYDSARAAMAVCAQLARDAAGDEATYVGVVTDSADSGSGGDADPSADADGRPTEGGQPPSVGKEDHGADTSELGGQPAEVFAHERQSDDDDVEGERGGRAPGRPLPVAAEADGSRVYLYDEWDYLAGTHLPAWCRLVERRLDGDDFTFIGDVRRRYAVLGSRLRRQFASIRPTGWVRVHRSDDGDELDLDAVIEAVVDRRTGHAADERLHIRRDRAAREVATAFLVDLSASTGSAITEPAQEPEPEEEPAQGEPQRVEYRFAAIDPWDFPPPPPESRRRVIDIAKESVALMCDALQLLGDRHAVYGFSGEGRHKVEFHVAKEFDDRTSSMSWASLAAMQPRRYTRMGPAIRHATAKLAVQPEKTKLLIVISDGYPQDIDYGPERSDKEYGLQDTARALQDAADAGIATYCVTIDPAGHDYLRRMCPDQNYLVIDDVPSLPGELAKLYGTLATTSSRRRVDRRRRDADVVGR